MAGNRTPDGNPGEVLDRSGLPYSDSDIVTGLTGTTVADIDEILFEGLYISCPNCGEHAENFKCSNCGAFIGKNGQLLFLQDEEEIPKGVDDNFEILAGPCTFVVDRKGGFPRSSNGILYVLLKVDGLEYQVQIHPNRVNMIEAILTRKIPREKGFKRIHVSEVRFAKIRKASHILCDHPETYGIDNLKAIKKS